MTTKTCKHIFNTKLPDGNVNFTDLYDPQYSDKDHVINQNQITIHLRRYTVVHKESEDYRNFTKTYNSPNGFTEKFIYNAFTVLMVEAMHSVKFCDEYIDWVESSDVYGFEYDKNEPSHLYPLMDS